MASLLSHHSLSAYKDGGHREYGVLLQLIYFNPILFRVKRVKQGCQEKMGRLVLR